MAEPWLKQLTVPEAREEEEEDFFDPTWTLPELGSFPGEVELYSHAMRAPECLEALLEAGARSAWICRAAALEGRADLLAMAVQNGCPCDPKCLFIAAREGQLAVLEKVLDMGPDLLIKHAEGVFPRAVGQAWTMETLVGRAGFEAACKGQAACLDVLLRRDHGILIQLREVGHAAAWAGSLDCLQLLRRYALLLYSKVYFCVTNDMFQDFPPSEQDCVRNAEDVMTIAMCRLLCMLCSAFEMFIHDVRGAPVYGKAHF